MPIAALLSACHSLYITGTLTLCSKLFWVYYDRSQKTRTPQPSSIANSVQAHPLPQHRSRAACNSPLSANETSSMHQCLGYTSPPPCMAPPSVLLRQRMDGCWGPLQSRCC
ncbi:hypothetical protein V8C86DRAFT_70683 [Haematococcus lacustris]